VIVADTKLIAHFFIPGDYTVDARSVFLKDPDWVAPLMWKSEFRKVVAMYLRQGYFNIKDALAMASEAERLLHGNEYVVPADSVLKMASESQCSAYDCEFAALALDLGIKLVTPDKVILSAFPEIAVHIRKFEPL
jgi:predicted nucleic acid-binding protein